MAPPVDQPDAMADEKPISTVVIFMAMHTEAQPLVERFKLTKDDDSVFPKGVPWVRYHGVYKDLKINIIQPGKDPVLGVDSVGTVTASLVTYASIQALQPDLIINAGTAGGFKAKGASIGDVFLVTDVAFHDRRIPIPKAFLTPSLAKELVLKTGKLSTGDSIDMTPHDEASIIANDATLKDMEGAAVAYVADLLKVPVILIKAVTDIVDGEKPSAEEFLQNLQSVTAALDMAVAKVIDFIGQKCLTDDAKPIKTILDGSNFEVWSEDMCSFLKEQKLWRYVTGDIPRPIMYKDEDDIEYINRLKEWESKSCQILTWIRNTCESSINLQFGDSATAQEVWNILSKRYSIVVELSSQATPLNQSGNNSSSLTVSETTGGGKMSFSKKNHWSHPKHELEMVFEGSYKCNGCKMDGLGQRYRCKPCKFNLHEECLEAFPGSEITFRRYKCQFLEKPEHFSGTGCLKRCGHSKCREYNCDACGMSVEGFVYHCSKSKKDFHPKCAKLPSEIFTEYNVKFMLQDEVRSKCQFCNKKKLQGTDVPGLSYVSSENGCDFHVCCWMKRAMQNTSSKSGGNDLSLAFEGRKLPLSKSKGSGGGKARKWFKIVKLVLSAVASILLGDPSTLLATTAAHIITEYLFHIG